MDHANAPDPTSACTERGASRQDDLVGSIRAEASSRTRRAQPFPLIGLDDPLAITPKIWVVDGVIAAGEISSVIGSAFTGKSTLVSHLAINVACGRSWFGHTTTSAGVIYLALERAQVTLRRLRTYRDRLGQNDLPLWLISDSFDLLRHGDVERLIGTVQMQSSPPVRLIVIDTFRRAIVGDENSARDMAMATHGLVRLAARTGAHVMVIHHTPKRREAEASGHSSFAATADMLMLVTNRNGRRKWQITQANDLAELPSGDFSIRNEDDVPIVVPAIENPKRSPATVSPDAKLTLDAIRTIAPCTRRDARRAAYAAYGERRADAKRRAYNDSLDALVSCGWLTMTGKADSDIISMREREDSVRNREADTVAHVSSEREDVRPLRADLTALTPDDPGPIPEFLRRN